MPVCDHNSHHPSWGSGARMLLVSRCHSPFNVCGWENKMNVKLIQAWLDEDACRVRDMVLLWDINSEACDNIGV